LAVARERLGDERERLADDRDDDADLREAGQADRDSEVNLILSAADARDAKADLRDADADRRDEAAALNVMVYGTSAERPFLGRRQAAKDRKEARHDRSAGHIDRFLLSGSKADTPANADNTDNDVER
jgi:hypothetical protein